MLVSFEQEIDMLDVGFKEDTERNVVTGIVIGLYGDGWWPHLWRHSNGEKLHHSVVHLKPISRCVSTILK